MTLHPFLSQERDAILMRCKSKPIRPHLAAAAYEELLDVWNRRDAHGENLPASKRSLGMGFTVLQVVEAYSVVTKTIAEHAAEAGLPETEIPHLERCLDTAVAEAVTASADWADEDRRERFERLGELARDLRNALSAAMASQSAIETGLVAATGGTARLVTKSLERIRDLIDDALSEARLQGDPVLKKTRISLVRLVGGIEATVTSEARSRRIPLRIEAEPDVEILVDGPMILSAVSNLIKDCFRRALPGEELCLRALAARDRAAIEVESADGAEGTDTPNDGGLGLALSRMAIALHAGSFSASRTPRGRRTYRLELPRAYH